MEKKEVLKKFLKLRRTSSAFKFLMESKMNFEAHKNQCIQHLQLLKELPCLNQLLNSERLIWKIDRTQSFWEIDCQKPDESFFKSNFRMKRSVFFKLCEMLPGMRKNDTVMREAIPLDKRIAISLYALGSSAEYRTIANMFGVGKATVCSILLEFCNEVWRVLAPKYLNNFPLKKEKVEELVTEFNVLGFPQCMGAIDGCHIEIHPSLEDATDYYNYKGWYSVVLLALVDARCRFIYVSCGSPGRCNDSQIYQRSSLKTQLDQCNILADLKKDISNVPVPVHIIGDSAFRLSETLMKPYPFHVAQSSQQKSFNYALSKSRRVVENAFGQLKARFRRIGKGVDNAIKNSNAIVLACCALHNFLNEHNDVINENWLQSLEAVEKNRSYPEYVVTLTENNRHSNNNPERIRQAISEYLCVQGESSTNTVGDSGAALLVDGDGDGGGTLLADGDSVISIDCGDTTIVDGAGTILEFIS